MTWKGNTAMQYGQPDEAFELTLSYQVAQASLIGVGRLSVLPGPLEDGRTATVEVRMEELLKGSLVDPGFTASLQPNVESPGLSLLESDGYRGLLFLAPRSASLEIPFPRTSIGPGEATLELPFGLDPALALEAPGFVELRRHVERLLELRRGPLEVALAALAADQRRLREESAFDLAAIDDLATLLRPEELQFLLSLLEDPQLGDSPRLALVRALRQVPAALSLLLDALRSLVEEDFVAGAFKIQAVELLTDFGDTRDQDLFGRLLDSDLPILRSLAAAGLVDLGTPEALSRVVAAAAEHPDPETRDVAAELLRLPSN